jgi:hypothetical protein
VAFSIIKKIKNKNKKKEEEEEKECGIFSPYT